jgi:hypothetical protein
MKCKVNGNVPISNCDCLNQRENLASYVGLFSRFFNRVGNWMNNVEVANLNSTALIYSKVVKMPSCATCTSATCVPIDDRWKSNAADPVWEHSFLNQKKPDFIRVEVDEFARRLCDKSIVFSLKTSTYNRVVAEFCPAKKILLTTDWCHDESKLEFVETFLTMISSMGLIAPRNQTIVKPLITLGADPELEFVDQDTNQVLHCSEAGIQDRELMPGSSTGRIGRDGSGAQREIRPEPSTTAEGLVENISKLIEVAKDERWSLRGDKFSLGGHIHIGGITESRGFIQLLDHYLAPLSVLNATARTNSSYGKAGDYRKQSYGLEYRVPPAGWLASKKLARVTLQIVKLAAEKHYFGEDIELTDDLNHDFAVLGLTMEETVDFFTEIDSFRTKGLPDNLQKAWGFKEVPKFILEFRDQWNEETKKYINDLVLAMAKEDELGGRVVLYGLDANRGNVFSLVMSHMNGIDMPETYGFMPPLKSGAGVNHVGIPAAIRGNLGEAKKMNEIVLEVIKRTINPPAEKKKKSAKKEIVEPLTEVELPNSWAYSTSGSGMYAAPTYSARQVR